MREILLVARREYLAYVGAWGFWLSLITTPLLLAVMIGAPLLLRQAEPERRIAVIASPADQALLEKAFAAPAPGRPDTGVGARYKLVRADVQDPKALTPALTGQGEEPLFGALVVTRAAGDVDLQYWSTNLTDRAPLRVAQDALSASMRRSVLASRGVAAADMAWIETLQPKVSQFDPRAAPGAGAVSAKDRAPLVAALMAAFALWTAVFSIANMLLSGVIEEKSSRVLDTLLSSAAPVQILAGKLLGVAALSFTLFTVWGGAGAGIASLAAAAAPSTTLEAFRSVATPELIALFGFCFLAGYLMFGAAFLAIGSLCESLQEAQTLIGPLILVLVLPVLLFAPAFENPASPIVRAASWVPLFTPFLTPIRAAAGMPPLEAIGLCVMLVVTIFAILFGAARVFQAGVSGSASAADVRRRFAPKLKMGG
ncbi:MAG: ABC transporter permease [Alphaproteobacteria bacterium]|nr:ABC transporter permease [Alphaproteobacteria bacterium]